MDDLEYDFPAICTTGVIGQYFLPVMNPDGYEYSHLDDRMWRKNRRWLGNQCIGVDLNRNFSIGWGGKGSSDNPTSPFYRGPGPFSEPESTAVRAIFENNGNTYKVGISRDVMYGASGTSNDWCYGEAGIPYCYLIELRSKEHKFKLPSEEIKETGNEILDSVQALMEFVDNYKEPEIKFPLAMWGYFWRWNRVSFLYQTAVNENMLKVSNGRSDNPGVWLDGSIHPREWISTAVVTYIADQLVKTFHKQPVSVTGKDWYILPVMNPDGYEYTHTFDRMWRKNRARYDPGNIFFRGPKPFSEPETSAVRRTITESGTEFKVFLSFHSYGE
ncbi:Molting carboxypeptidase A, partial [Operophtera brumata]